LRDRAVLSARLSSQHKREVDTRERRLRDVLSKGGFTRFRRAAETPFNMILEARP
jgi:hypothetical protein